MSQIPQNYIFQNDQLTKSPVIVVQIQGVPDLITNRRLNTRILYGDPVAYGDPDLVYGGLRSYVVIHNDNTTSTFRPYLDLEGSSLTIGQRLEPEQGKASVSTLALSFIDFQGYMTQLVSPGIIIPEILGAEVRVFLGFSEISYPEDFFEVFRGYISGVTDGPGSVQLQLSDPNIKRRQQIFFIGQSKVLTPIASFDVMVFVISTIDFFAQIKAANGDFFPSVGAPKCHCYIQIDDEWIEVQPHPTDTTRFDVIARGARGTTAANHDPGAQVTAALQLGDASNRQNAMDMALQIQLSGWDGPWITGEEFLAIGPEPDPDPATTTTNFLTMPNNVDAVAKYGLVAGDWVILQGSLIPANNNVLMQIVRFDSFDGQPNRLIYLNVFSTLFKEQNTPATLGFRSQYDVLPIEAGLKLTPKDVDIDQHIAIKNTFLGGNGNDLIFFITSPESSGKSFLESQIYFPIGAYSLTRRGKLSCGYHSPPIANQNLSILNSDNVLDPGQIKPARALNNRGFFNEIDITFNYDDAGNPLSSLVIADADSMADPSQGGIGIVSTLPIDARGVYAGYSSSNLQKRAFFLLTRYKRGAVMFTIKVNWKVGSLIEAGDIVTIQDHGTLQIANFNTGQRNLKDQLFEVIDRTFDLRGGNVSLKLLSGVGATLTDRFATISPSSLLDTGSTGTQLVIKDSFGALYPGNESKKWQQYLGLPILVHSRDYSVSTQVTLISIDASNPYILNTTDLGYSPPADYVIDIAPYPNSTDPTQNAFYKIMHAFWTPMVLVVSGIDSTSFTVSGGQVGKFFVGAPIRVHSLDYSSDSGDTTIFSVVGTTITTVDNLGFTPSANQQIDLLGFPDFSVSPNAGAPYRWI